ncbi:Fluconazole resistance protein 1 [Saitoella coloradoensis]
MKKGKSGCSRCLRNNQLCTYSERVVIKEEREYPRGYVELLQNRIKVLQTALEELLRRHTGDQYRRANPGRNGDIAINQAIAELHLLGSVGEIPDREGAITPEIRVFQDNADESGGYDEETAGSKQMTPPSSVCTGTPSPRLVSSALISPNLTHLNADEYPFQSSAVSSPSYFPTSDPFAQLNTTSLHNSVPVGIASYEISPNNLFVPLPSSNYTTHDSTSSGMIRDKFAQTNLHPSRDELLQRHDSGYESGVKAESSSRPHSRTQFHTMPTLDVPQPRPLKMKMRLPASGSYTVTSVSQIPEEYKQAYQAGVSMQTVPSTEYRGMSVYSEYDDGSLGTVTAMGWVPT